MTEPGTLYRAEIKTPSGLTFHASIYVPPDAEHADQHENAERVAYAVTRMLTDHERGVEARATDPEDRFAGIGACFNVPPTLRGLGSPVVCKLPHGHTGAHKSNSGMQWSERH